MRLAAAVTDGILTIETTRLRCPGDSPTGTYTFFMGHREAIDKYAAEHGGQFDMSPEHAVQLEINAKAPGVGPPIDVVRMDVHGVHW